MSVFVMRISLEMGKTSLSLSERAYLSLISKTMRAPSLPADMRYLSSEVTESFSTPLKSCAWNSSICWVLGNL